MMLPNIDEFTREMERLIDEAEPEHDEDWKDLEIGDFISHFKEEVRELFDLLEQYCPKCGSLLSDDDMDYSEVVHEALDVANMAYMTWWHAKRKINLNLVQSKEAS